jgi:hypothetical protein
MVTVDRSSPLVVASRAHTSLANVHVRFFIASDCISF